MKCSKRLFYSVSKAKSPFQILFLGTDDFATQICNSISLYPKDIVSHLHVITPPDRETRSNRKLVTVRPQLRTFAEKSNLPVTVVEPKYLSSIPEKLNYFLPNPSLPSILIASAFGYMIPSNVIEAFPESHALNIHPSLLPLYRGSAPVENSILNGDKTTGITIQTLSKKRFDAGLIVAQKSFPLEKHFTTPSLRAYTAKESGKMLLDTLKNFELYKQCAYKQDPSKVTMAPKLTREHAHINWNTMTSDEILTRDRAISHRYALFTTLDKKRMKLKLIHPSLDENHVQQFPQHSKPGSAFFDPSRKLLMIKTTSTNAKQDNHILVSHIKPEGKPFTPALDFWNGYAKPFQHSSLQFV